MTERDSKKQDEFPLLRMNGAGGDGGRGGETPKALSSMWNVTSYTPRSSWFKRWPELLSTCWMTLVLFGITFLVFYAIGMVSNKHEGFVMVQCDENNSSQNVFLHHIVPHFCNSILFSVYADFIAHLSVQYPNLQFNVIFLIEDTPRINELIGRHANRLLFRSARPPLTLGQWEKREITDFQREHPNVNINTVPLSRFMSVTPLRHKWHLIPTYMLSFYARVYSIWQESGIGFDLAEYNDQFNKKKVDSRLTDILRMHNNRMSNQLFSDSLNTDLFNRDKEQKVKERQFMNEVMGFVARLINSSSMFFNNSNFTKPVAENVNIDNIVVPNVTRANLRKRDTAEQAIITSNNSKSEKHIIMDLIDSARDLKNVYNLTSNENDTKKVDDKSALVNISEVPELIFYEVVIVGPMPNDNEENQRKTGIVNIDTNGLFVSATTQHHPFLCQVLSAGSKKTAPHTAISNAMKSQCNDFAYIRDEYYCKNIHVL